MAKRKSYAKKRKAKNRKFILGIILLTVLFAAFIYYSNANMDNEIKSLDEEITSNTKKMEDLDSEITDLEKDYNIRNTDEFKEKVAKERLGMVKKEADDKKSENNLDKEENDNSN